MWIVYIVRCRDVFSVESTAQNESSTKFAHRQPAVKRHLLDVLVTCFRFHFRAHTNVLNLFLFCFFRSLGMCLIFQSNQRNENAAFALLSGFVFVIRNWRGNMKWSQNLSCIWFRRFDEIELYLFCEIYISAASDDGMDLMMSTLVLTFARFHSWIFDKKKVFASRILNPKRPINFMIYLFTHHILNRQILGNDSWTSMVRVTIPL